MTDYIRPHWHRAALVIIDVQKDFLDDGAMAVPGTTSVVPRIASLVHAFRDAGRPVVHVIGLYPPGSSDIDAPRRDSIENGAWIATPGAEGSQAADGLLPDGFRLDFALLLAGGAQVVGQRLGGLGSRGVLSRSGARGVQQ